MRDAFSGLHPAAEFLYFGAVVTFAVIFTHPICLLISLFCAFACNMNLRGRRKALKGLRVILPLIIVTAALNPLFSHEGATVLAYFPNGNPLTAESLAFGLASAAMLASALCWFSCFNAVITADKLVWLFGRAAPALSLVLAMTLRFVPRFTAQIKTVSDAQKGVGQGAAGGSARARITGGMRIFSATATWALESAVETADSMKSRGCGLPGRTAFSIYRFDRRSALAALFFLLCTAYIAAGALLGGVRFAYYPALRGTGFSPFSVSVFLCYFALCASPIAINTAEDRKWRALKSKI